MNAELNYNESKKRIKSNGLKLTKWQRNYRHCQWRDGDILSMKGGLLSGSIWQEQLKRTGGGFDRNECRIQLQ
jgi:hypothetical protein